MEETGHLLHWLDKHLDCLKWDAAPEVVIHSALDMLKSSASLRFYLSSNTQIYTCLTDIKIRVIEGKITALILPLRIQLKDCVT